MKTDLEISQQQRLGLSQRLQLSLNCLQIPAVELSDYISAAASSNPLLEEVVSPSAVSFSDMSFAGAAYMRQPADNDSVYMYAPEMVHSETYTEHLENQLLEREDLPDNILSLAKMIIASLNSKGFLDESIDELAEAFSTDAFLLNQALYVVQELEPIGTGARSLSECLLLQLTQSIHFNKYTVKAVKNGLELIAENNITALAELLGTEVKTAKSVCRVVKSLNPIPSSGFSSGVYTHYTMPEAEVITDGDSLRVEMFRERYPSLAINPYYRQLLSCGDRQTQDFLAEHLIAAENVIAGISERWNTLETIIGIVAEIQRDFFMHGGALRTLTMSMIAEKTGLSISTVSRAVKNKYILCRGNQIVLRELFTNGGLNTQTDSLSADYVKSLIKNIIKNEDAAHPLSDSDIVRVLASNRIDVARRTVAKYRTELKIAPSFSRAGTRGADQLPKGAR